MDIQTVTAASERLKEAGVDHIVLADGRILVEGSRESSKIAVRKWRKSPEYKQYLRLKKRYADMLGIKGGHTLRKQPNGKYKLVKLTKEEKAGLIRRKKAQLASPNMKGNKTEKGKKGGKGGGGSSSSKKVVKPAPKKVVKPAPKKVVKPGKKVVKPAPKKVVKRSRD
jgi:hypothetical protein